MLEPHLKNEAEGSQMEVGVAFFIIGGFYTFSSIVTGMVSYFAVVYPTKLRSYVHALFYYYLEVKKQTHTPLFNN